jgi:hypothetical protein
LIFLPGVVVVVVRPFWMTMITVKLCIHIGKRQCRHSHGNQNAVPNRTNRPQGEEWIFYKLIGPTGGEKNTASLAGKGRKLENP